MKKRNFRNIKLREWLHILKKKQDDKKQEEIEFELRKKEFLYNVEGIVRYLEGTQQKNGRKHLLLLVTSKAWTFVEIKKIIYSVQNKYADISIYIEKNTVDKNGISEFFFEEYGLKISFLDELDILMQDRYDTVLCLLETWNGSLKRIRCQNAYAVCESEETLGRIRKKIHINSMGEIMKICKEEKGEWYSGFVYACNGKQMDYKDALGRLYGSKSAQIQEENNVEKGISVVAIYGIE